MKTSITLFSVLSSLVLFAYLSFVRAFDLNCSTESAILNINGPYVEALVGLIDVMNEVCIHKFSQV